MRKKLLEMLIVIAMVGICHLAVGAADNGPAGTKGQGVGQAMSSLQAERPTGPEAREAASFALSKIQAKRGWKKADMTEGFEIFEIPAAALLVDEQVWDLTPLYQPLGMWVFPVKTDSDESSEFSLSIRRKEKKWMLHSEFGLRHARNMISCAKAWPRSQGYDFRLISVPVLDIRLIEISRAGQVKGFVRSYSDEASDFDPTNLGDPAEVALEIQDVVKRFTESRRGR